jgi:hypothetical protein
LWERFDSTRQQNTLTFRRGGFVKQIQKEYDRAFLLEPTKLTRLIEIIHARLTDQQHTTLRDSFEVYVSGSRREDMSNVDDVLDLDNSRKKTIERLVACNVEAPSNG